MSVNRNNFLLWMEDLLTTDDPQSTMCLTTELGDCCLGRCCKVAIKNGVKLDILNSTVVNNKVVNCITYDGHRCVIPPAVKEWLGIPNGYHPSVNDVSLAELNDNCGYTFKQIAEAMLSDPFWNGTTEEQATT